MISVVGISVGYGCATMLVLWLVIAASALVHWLYRLNKDYYVMSFFAKRVRTKDGQPLSSLVALPKGVTIFGNSFDLYGKDHGE